MDISEPRMRRSSSSDSWVKSRPLKVNAAALDPAVGAHVLHDRHGDCRFAAPGFADDPDGLAGQ
jgi:hypothetical protein